MATILDGKKLSEEILEDLKEKSGKRLKLAAILIGNNKNSLIFLRQKEKACKFVGVDFQLYQFPEKISQESLEDEVRKISNLENHGIIIQLPLPEHINTQKVLNLIPSEKDVDLLSEKTPQGKILSPVLAGILELFKKYKIRVEGKNVVVAGYGKLVGRPAADWMKRKGAKVFVIDEKTSNIPSITQKADILISGTGKKGLVDGNMVKKGVVIVDAAGDVDFESVEKKASYITPVPGGLGPMTVAMLLKNLILLNKKK